MSLNFDLSKIADRATKYPTVPGEHGDTMNPVTYAMIWATLGTDIGHLKDEATASEAYLRYVALGYDTGDDALTLADFIGHVGLRTNVFNTGKRAFAAKLKRIQAMRAADEKRAVAMRAEREPAAATA